MEKKTAKTCTACGAKFEGHHSSHRCETCQHRAAKEANRRRVAEFRARQRGYLN